MMDSSMSEATTQARDKGPVASEINGLSAMVNELESALDRHYKRISSVLALDHPQPGDGDKKDPGMYSPVTNALMDIRDRLTRITVNVNRMSDRVEL